MKNLRDKNLEKLKDNYVYNENMEHDACGVGLVVSTEGNKSRKVVKAGIEALKGTKETINDIKKEFHKRKNFVHSKLNALEKISCFEPGGAFYAFPNISQSGMSAQKFADIALEEKGVALVPGTSFGDSAENFVRISYANSMENLEKAIYRLSAI